MSYCICSLNYCVGQVYNSYPPYGSNKDEIVNYELLWLKIDSL